jgi:D-arabinose 1-dehydrogenase-like Zn-dependent alcohol dehydrogenase
MLFEPNDQGLILGQNPVTIGHEATGVVVSTGSGDAASKFKAGDNVGFLCAVECCFECVPCKTVHNAYCTTGKTKMQGFSLNGYFQEYVVVDARSSMVLPDGCMSPLNSAPKLPQMGKANRYSSGRKNRSSPLLRRSNSIPRRPGL